MSTKSENLDESARLSPGKAGNSSLGAPRRASNTLTSLAAIMLFSASATAGLKIGLLTADAMILRYVYGAQRVATEHLEIVRSKPDLVVSNGDVLKGYSFIHFLVIVPLFLSIGAGGTVGGILLLSLSMRQRLDQNQRSRDGNLGCLPAIVFLPLTVGLVAVKSLWPNLIVVALALAIGWATAAFRRSSPPG